MTYRLSPAHEAEIAAKATPVLVALRRLLADLSGPRRVAECAAIDAVLWRRGIVVLVADFS